ncbi:glycosyltransferase [candidate division CSSED10-310 bacterium]|uniref:Glycosyltransferase n=1 Tax=candidate division CSSED10-310 bacterium TaxID=2855610 RepID=A0ABV6Z5S5_UNCC1
MTDLKKSPISVVLVNWNGSRWIRDLVTSLKNQTLPPAERIIVDNGSTDGSQFQLEKLYPGWRLIQFARNSGFARAANSGIRSSKEPYILLLNTDIVLAPTYLEQLLHFMEDQLHVGAAMGLLRRPNGNLIDSAGVILSRARRRPLDLYSEKSLVTPFPRNTPFPVFTVNGAAPLLRRFMLDSIEFENSYFDESFISYFEDVDLGWRARNLGWEFFCVPTAKAEHVRGGSGGLSKPALMIQAYANRFRLYLKNERMSAFLILAPYNISLELYRLILKPLLQPLLFKSLLILFVSLPEILFLRQRIVKNFSFSLAPRPLISNISCARPKNARIETAGASISVIVINHNTRQLLRNCLHSLLADQTSLKVIVVDNNSRDGSAEMVAREFPQIRLIRFPENRGFSTAVNAGLAEQERDFYLILNSDTESSPLLPQKLATLMDRNVMVGIISPMIRNMDGTLQISWGPYPTLINEYKQKRLHRTYQRKTRVTRNTLEKLYSRTRSVDWVTGACLMIRNQTLRHIGPMDQNFHLYFEDIDWCYRAKKAGWEILYTPQIAIKHLGGASAASSPHHAAKHYRISQDLFYKKHYSRWYHIGLKLFFLLKGKNLLNPQKFMK